MKTVSNPLCTRHVRGTIVEINPAALQVTILTVAGQRESLSIENSDVVKELEMGDHIVRMELEERGRVNKIVKT